MREYEEYKTHICTITSNESYASDFTFCSFQVDRDSYSFTNGKFHTFIFFVSMYTTQDIIASFENETRICKHLWEKIPAVTYDWKPDDSMRTFRELLEYMTRMGTAPIELLSNGYDPEVMKQMRLDTESRDVSVEFETMMDDQLAIIVDFVDNATDDFMNEEIMLFGKPQTRKSFFLEVALKNFPAYRMQLFQYLKAGQGMSELNTSNLWMGMDPQ